MSLRAQVGQDQAFCRRLYGANRAAEVDQAPWDAATKALFLDQQFAAQSAHLESHRPDADYLIVQRGETPIGRLYIDREETGEGWRIVEIALLPDAAGKGIGRALIGWVIDRASHAGATSVDLHVATDNDTAIAFYHRNDFVDVPSAFDSHRRLSRAIDCIS